MILFDSLSKALKKITDNPVKIYFCGPTVYDYIHIGNARPLILADILVRVLKKKSHVIFVRNITDIDDKIIDKAKLLNQSPSELANKMFTAFKNDCKNLNLLEPNFQPKVSESIKEIIDFIHILLNKNCAYITSDGIYFNIQSINYFNFENKTNIISRIEVHKEKKNNADFALWKFYDNLYDNLYESPWGMGRPGWHIECSAMSLKHLGEEFTIHGGGEDLIFPHHENEVAQNLAYCGKIPAKIWIHNGMVSIKDLKMSKSTGNMIYVKDFVKNDYDSDLLRYIFLNHNYRSNINFTEELLNQSILGLNKLRVFYFSEIYNKNIIENIDIANVVDLFHDLNTSKTLQVLHQTKDPQIFLNIIKTLGFIFKPLKDICHKDIEMLILERNKFRALKNFIEADKIKNQLIEFVHLKDGEQTSWYFK